MEKNHVNRANAVQRTGRHAWKAELNEAVGKIKANWKATRSRREMMKLGNHLLQDLGLNAEGQPLHTMHSRTKIGKSQGRFKGKTFVAPVWCDCRMT